MQFHNIVIVSSYSKKAETQINCIFKRKNECIKKFTGKLGWFMILKYKFRLLNNQDNEKIGQILKLFFYKYH